MKNDTEVHPSILKAKIRFKEIMKARENVQYSIGDEVYFFETFGRENPPFINSMCVSHSTIYQIIKLEDEIKDGIKDFHGLFHPADLFTSKQDCINFTMHLIESLGDRNEPK